ncbi:MAG: hypothetical protein AB7E79_09730 [Rhodospirillaceae bacterium]
MKDDQRAELWLKRADEIRAEAMAMPMTDARASLLRLANEWEYMGLRARARATGEGAPDSARSQSAPKGWEEIPSQGKGPESSKPH